MKNKSLFLGSLLLSMIATSATEAKTSIAKTLYTEQYQQEEIEVEGQVLDADGSPMLGVSVVVKDTHRGVVTDENGRFSLQADENAVLVFRFLGQGNTMQTLDPELQQRAAHIKLLILDVDGVLTDGRIFIRGSPPKGR